MNKVINVTIGNSQFDVEEIVYHKLEKYLTEVGKLFKDNPEKKEILNDLEDRIAEKFSQNEGKAVTEKQLGHLVRRRPGTTPGYLRQDRQLWRQCADPG